MDFPTKLSRLCWQKGWSQRDLAEALDGVSKSTVSNWLSGKTEPRRPELAGLARLFGVSVDYLVLDELEEPSGDGLDEPQRRLLWAAETVGYEVALRRIMNAPGGEPPTASRSKAREDEHTRSGTPSEDRPGGAEGGAEQSKGRRRR
jgi:transcriptional regulator with XRE-family HTH domain